MKVLILFVIVLALIVLRTLAEPLGMSVATATAVWVAVSLLVAKPLFVQASEAA